ncbi:MAG: Phospholipid-binding protein [Rhodospirillaceae bacterium]|nr:MAG: Phospholipid-binding protein [Rhodospirillaceae bacterium]
MFKKTIPSVLMLSSVMLSGCVTTDTPDLPEIGVDCKWDANSQCVYLSPEIALIGVPNQTKNLQFRLDDLDRPMNDHGGGTIAYTASNTIAKGAVKGIRGPCPPLREPHKYKLYVVATDENENKIAAGSGIARCCSE